ncbi:family 16 glycoside hydrolase [Rubrolithibacter danxiaensis]|uniref:family 16 glycoside hydrolase n=1 Tax=Rubrolithibacter danxiaensis TaxID=3390805 RepID=UPI003BF80FA3
MRRCFNFIIALILLNCYQVLAQSELPYSTLDLSSLKDFKSTNGNWKVAGDVYYDINKEGKGSTKSGNGILVNDPSSKSHDHLFTNFEHGDLDLELDFMMDKGSNAGVYLQGRYEIQMFDSWGVEKSKVTDCGAIYQRWDESRPEGFKGYEGHAPAQNVAKAPGLWQHYRIIFRAPRFNSKGEKIENAKFVKVIHNGVVIHENIEVTGPTRAAAFEDEKPLGPLMIQGDHGAVAIRNIKYKAYGTEAVTLTGMKLSSYDGSFKSFSDLNASTFKREMAVDLLAHAAPGSKDKFGGKITGTLNVPVSGKYLINLDLKWIPSETNPQNPNGAGELMIGGKKILAIEGTKGGTATALVDLQAGKLPFELNYYKNFGLWYARSNDIVLGIEGPGVPYTILNPVIPEVEAVGAIKVLSKGVPVMQRGFVNNHGTKKTHVISVAEPGDANYTYDLKRGEFIQIWRGDFLETTQMWYGRGETQLAVPLGSVTELPAKPALAFLSDKNAAWPDSNLTYNYSGYDVENDRPIIKYTLGNTPVRESFISEDGGKKLTHIIEITNKADKDLWALVAESNEIEKLANGLYAINNKQFYIDLKDIKKPLIRTNSKGLKELIVPIDNTVNYSIIW